MAIYSGFSREKWWFSTAMWVITRGYHQFSRPCRWWTRNPHPSLKWYVPVPSMRSALNCPWRSKMLAETTPWVIKCSSISVRNITYFTIDIDSITMKLKYLYLADWNSWDITNTPSEALFKACLFQARFSSSRWSAPLCRPKSRDPWLPIVKFSADPNQIWIRGVMVLWSAQVVQSLAVDLRHFGPLGWWRFMSNHLFVHVFGQQN